MLPRFGQGVQPPAPRTDPVSSFRWCWGPTDWASVAVIGVRGCPRRGWAAAEDTPRPHSWQRVPDHAGPLQTLAVLGVRALLRGRPLPAHGLEHPHFSGLERLCRPLPPSGPTQLDVLAKRGRWRAAWKIPPERPASSPPPRLGQGLLQPQDWGGLSRWCPPSRPEAGAGSRNPPPCPPVPPRRPFPTFAPYSAMAECTLQSVREAPPRPTAPRPPPGDVLRAPGWETSRHQGWLHPAPFCVHMGKLRPRGGRLAPGEQWDRAGPERGRTGQLLPSAFLFSTTASPLPQGVSTPPPPTFPASAGVGGGRGVLTLGVAN